MSYSENAAMQHNAFLRPVVQLLTFKLNHQNDERSLSLDVRPFTSREVNTSIVLKS